IAFSYDRNAAYEYTTRNCESHNISYPYILHGDGANFVSQVVYYAGGSQQNDDWNSTITVSPDGLTNSFIYEMRGVFTLSWIRVVDLTSYLLQNNIAKICPLEELQKGDLIMYTSQDGTGHQSVVVINPDPNNPEIAYHSRDETKCNYIQPCNNCNGTHSLFTAENYTFQGLCIINNQ
ncbi:1519_t:CDS:1, partial [Cetraspora pellucida]